MDAGGTPAVRRRPVTVSARPRILFLSQCLPYPPHSGVASRTFNVLKQLQDDFDVTLLAFSRRNHQVDSGARRAAVQELAKLGITVLAAVPIPNERSKTRRIWDHGRSVVSGRPYTFFEYADGAFGRALRRELSCTKPDLIHFDTLDLYRWLPGLPDVPVTCTHHSIESELLRHRARHIGSPPLRRYLSLQADLIERVERRLPSKFTLNVMMSEVDGRRLEALAPGSSTAVIPNGTDTEFFTPAADDCSVPGRVTFLGPTYMFPNRDAIDYFLSAAWPRIRAADGSASFHLIGKSPDGDRSRYGAEPGVTALGYVPDIRPHMWQARCCVVPLRVGGGTRLKILDAWAMGKAVVSTSIGCEGLDVVDGENILIRDTPGEFADAVLQVLSDVQLRKRLEHGGRATAVDTYSWGAVGKKLCAHYARLLRSTNAAAACVS